MNTAGVGRLARSQRCVCQRPRDRTVDLAEVAGAQLKVHTGDVAIGRLTGPAQISNGSGNITATSL